MWWKYIIYSILMENILAKGDQGNTAYIVFVDLQKAFDIAEDDILLAKLADCGVWGITDKCLVLLSNETQYISINSHNSNVASVLYSVPQGSVLSVLLFSIYINDLYQSILFCKVHDFTDDTNLLHFNKSIVKLNKSINVGMKNPTYD